MRSRQQVSKSASTTFLSPSNGAANTPQDHLQPIFKVFFHIADPHLPFRIKLSLTEICAGAAKIQYGSLHSVPETISKLKALRSHLLAGNVINLLTLTLFLAAVIYSHIRIGRASAGEASSSGFRRLYFCLALLFIRNLYRVCSYSRGVIDLYNDDPLSLPLKIKPLWIEGFNYGFDALVAFIILVALAVWYPDHSSLDEGEDVAGPVMGGGMGKLKNLFGGKARSGANMRMEGLPGA